MKPCDFPQTNITLTAPEDAENLVAPIKAFKGETPEGHPQFITCFEVSDEDRALLEAEGKLWVYVLGESFAPIMLSATSPFDDDAERKP